MINVFELHLSHHNHNDKARGHPPALSPVFVFVFIFVSLFVFVFIFIYVLAEVRLQPCPPLEDKLLTMIFLLRRMTAGVGIMIVLIDYNRKSDKDIDSNYNCDYCNHKSIDNFDDNYELQVTTVFYSLS